MGNVPIFGRIWSLLLITLCRWRIFNFINDSGRPFQSDFNGVYVVLLCFINIVKVAREQTLILVILNVSTYKSIIISFSWENV